MNDAGGRPRLKSVERLIEPGVTLKSFSVFADAISVHLQAELARHDVAGVLERIAAATRGRFVVPVHLGELAMVASVESVTSRRGSTTLLLRAPKERRVTDMLFPSAGSSRRLQLEIGVPAPTAEADAHNAPANRPRAAPTQALDEVRRLLPLAAAVARVDVADLLEELTTFTGRERNVVRGKRDLGQVSERQAAIVVERLRQMVPTAGAANGGSR